jgi:hypothetical protein
MSAAGEFGLCMDQNSCKVPWNTWDRIGDLTSWYSAVRLEILGKAEVRNEKKQIYLFNFILGLVVKH